MKMINSTPDQPAQLQHARSDEDEWYLEDDAGNVVAYKRYGKEPVFLDKEKALQEMSALICDQQQRIRGEADRFNSIFIGLHYGYQPCCIREFIEDIQEGVNPYTVRNIPGNVAGFIPCRKHTQEVLEGKATLESLLVNRESKSPLIRTGWTAAGEGPADKK